MAWFILFVTASVIGSGAYPVPANDHSPSQACELFMGISVATEATWNMHGSDRVIVKDTTERVG